MTKYGSSNADPQYLTKRAFWEAATQLSHAARARQPKNSQKKMDD
jgi:hypothetical protein